MKVDEYHIKLEKAVIKAIAIMETVAKSTQDIESFKQLTIGFNKIKDILGMKIDCPTCGYNEYVSNKGCENPICVENTEYDRIRKI